MATTIKTWGFLSGAESWSWTLASADSTGTWDSVVGNPLGSQYDRVFGRNKSDLNYCEITGTWASLFGIPTNLGVSSIQLIGGSTRCTIWNVGSTASTRGLVQVLNYDGSSVIATLRPASAFSAASGSWVEVFGTSQPIADVYKPATTSIRLRWTDVLATGNNTSAEARNHFDQLSIEIVHDYLEGIPLGAIDAGWFWRRSKPTIQTATAGLFDRIESEQTIQVPVVIEGKTILIALDFSNWPQVVNIGVR